VSRCNKFSFTYRYANEYVDVQAASMKGPLERMNISRIKGTRMYFTSCVRVYVCLSVCLSVCLPACLPVYPLCDEETEGEKEKRALKVFLFFFFSTLFFFFSFFFPPGRSNDILYTYTHGPSSFSTYKFDQFGPFVFSISN